MDYLPRTIDLELDQLLQMAPAIAIDGPKGVGKTGTAIRRVDVAWYLDQPEMRSAAESDSRFSTVKSSSLLLDEWQHCPQVWNNVRRAVDRGADPGRFLLTGSATPVSAEGTHSGAGRILSLRMRPMALHERGGIEPSVSLTELFGGARHAIAGIADMELNDYFEAIVSSGFPGIYRQAEPYRRRLLESYLTRVIDRDMPDQGLLVRRPEVLRRWLSAYAAATSTPTSYSSILDATTGGDGQQPAKTTTIAYRDHLTQLWLLDPVPGWLPTNSPLKRLQQAPKHHLADPALAARLLGVSTKSLAGRDTHLAGPLFESLVTLSVRALAQALHSTVHHLRMDGGNREVDLIIENDDGDIVACEVKLSPNIGPKDVRHLVWLREQMPERVVDTIVITTGSRAYRRSDGVAVVPLALLGP